MNTDEPKPSLTLETPVIAEVKKTTIEEISPIEKVSEKKDQVSTQSIISEGKEIRWKHDIRGCASNVRTKSLKGVSGYPDEIKPRITERENGNIFYERTVVQTCDLEVEIKKEISGQTITITEIWSGMNAKCSCNNYVKVSVENLPAGTYNVQVIEEIGTEHTQVIEQIIDL